MAVGGHQQSFVARRHHHDGHGQHAHRQKGAAGDQARQVVGRGGQPGKQRQKGRIQQFHHGANGCGPAGVADFQLPFPGVPPAGAENHLPQTHRQAESLPRQHRLPHGRPAGQRVPPPVPESAQPDDQHCRTGQPLHHGADPLPCCLPGHGPSPFVLFTSIP